MHESENRKPFENMFRKGKINKAIKKYEATYEELNNLTLSLISHFYNKSGISLICQNWLIFFYKNANIVDTFNAIKAFTITPKQSGQIYTLLKLDIEIYKYYPYLWK
jgi:hypothetical protein